MIVVRDSGRCKGALSASAAHQVIQGNSEAWRGFFSVKEQCHDAVTTSVTEHPEPSSVRGNEAMEASSRVPRSGEGRARRDGRRTGVTTEPAQMMPPMTSSPTMSSSVATTLPPARNLFSITFS